MDEDQLTDLLPSLPAPTPRRGSRRIVVTLLVVAVLLVVGGVAAAMLGGKGDGHPSKWDPRIADLAAFVERERGLEFEHPVFVDFLDTAAFRKEVTEHDELTDEDRAELESAESFLRALGLVHGDVDLEELGDDLAGEGIVGFYRFEDQRIVVRGEKLDDERRAVLVHELTHALQDQHFDIGERQDEGSSGEQAAFTAVVEADAESVRDAWADTLSASAREKLEESESSTAEDADFEDVPEVFVELMSYPYVLGPPFLEQVVEDRGESARNDLLRKPPTSEEQIVRPSAYLADDEPRKVQTPALRKGETAIDDSEDDFGMLSLLVVLSERVDFVTAWKAVEGWAGDASVAFTRSKVTCVRTDVAFDSPDQAVRFGSAFEQWAAGSQAKVDVDGDHAVFESCDPGKDAPAPADDGRISGLQALYVRLGLIEGIRSGGSPLPAAECLADAVIEHFGADRVQQIDTLLAEDPSDPVIGELQQVAAEAARGPCAGKA